MTISALFITAFFIGLSGAMMPGPLLTVTIAESMKRGFIAGPLIMLGHAALEISLIIALVAGLSAFLSSAAVSNSIALLGGGFLLYLGFSMSKDAIKGHISLAGMEEAQAGTEKNGLHPVLAGAVISLANPYWSIWWATVGLTYLSLSMESGRIGLLSFFSGHIMADLSWYTMVAALVAGGRKFISPQLYKYVIVSCGLFLLVLGAYFIFTGASSYLA
ncbi:MAG: LysE family transporter [Syntrophomonadaceae bacterium]|jgi:threonine/homoserine/homoserine lactone efflux protein|nr:LysE family transporter [Syntrophomonadaceae bacterium]